MSAHESKGRFGLSFGTYQQYPRDSLEYFRDIVSGMIAPYREITTDLGIENDELTLVLSDSIGVSRARIHEYPVSSTDGKRPITLVYSNYGFDPYKKAVQAMLPAGEILEYLPVSDLASNCVNTDMFLSSVGSLSSWVVSGELEKAGCTVQIEYPESRH
jgi:hypothetical protein